MLHEVTGRQIKTQTDRCLGVFKPMQSGKNAIGILRVTDPEKIEGLLNYPAYGRNINTDLHLLALKPDQESIIMKGTRTAAKGLRNEVNQLKKQLADAKKPEVKEAVDQSKLEAIMKLSAKLLKEDGLPRRDADPDKLKELEELKASL